MKLQRRKIRTEFWFPFRERERGGILIFSGEHFFNDYESWREEKTKCVLYLIRLLISASVQMLL